jgi:hypothetical protein
MVRDEIVGHTDALHPAESGSAVGIVTARAVDGSESRVECSGSTRLPTAPLARSHAAQQHPHPLFGFMSLRELVALQNFRPAGWERVG